MTEEDSLVAIPGEAKKLDSREDGKYYTIYLCLSLDFFVELNLAIIVQRFNMPIILWFIISK